MSELDLKRVQRGVGSELPLEELGDPSLITEDVGERGVVRPVALGPGVGADGGGIAVGVGEEDWPLCQYRFRDLGIR